MKKKRIPELALVTGADGGIGSAFCRELASRGIDLVLAGIVAEGLDKLSVEISGKYGVKTYCVVVDLTTPDGCRALEEFHTPSGRRPDMLVNNAGIFSFLPVCDLPDGKCQAFIDLHITAVTRLSRSYGRLFAFRGYGWILNMSSMSCWMPMPGLAMYAATKAYLRVFSRSLSYELRESGVRVMVACPGGIATDLFGLPKNLQKLALRIGAIAAPDRFARGAVKRLLRGDSQYINGFLNRVSIVAVGITPAPLRMMVKHKLLDSGITRP